MIPVHKPSYFTIGILRVFIAIVLISACSLASCDRHDSRLADIDAIMEDDPATALALLDSIRPEALSPSDHAYYALLYTQAQVKCRIEVSSDSLISIAYGKYSHESSGNLKMRACFYNAKVFFNRGDFKSAMEDAVVAYDIAKDAEDPYWTAKSAELMADILWYVYNYSQSEAYTHEAVEKYLLAGRIDNHRYALCDLASIYLNENKFDEAKSIVDSLYKVVTNETPVDSALLDYMSLARSSILLETNRLDELEKLWDETSDMRISNEDEIDKSIIKSTTSSLNDDAESATASLADAYGLSEDNKQLIRVMYADFRQSISSGKYQKAAQMADSIILMQSGIVEELLNESVISAQSDFYFEKAKYQQKQADWRLYALIAVAIVAIVIALLIIMIFRLRIRANKAEFETNLSSLMLFKGQTENENKRLESELERLFRQKWSTLNMLCAEYFNMRDSEASGAAALCNIRQELDKLKSTKNLKEIETAVDTYMGNIMTLLRQECTFMKEEDFRFLCLVFAGMSAKSVCLLTDIKHKLFYLKRDRLFKRIADSTATHKELFLSKIK